MKTYLKKIDKVIEKGPFKDTWESLSGYQTPDWYQKAKFGIFIHWGVFSVPAFGNEWYPKNMYMQGSPEFEHHVKTYGAHKDFGYKDFVPMFTAENFEPEKWAKLFEEAGAEYVVPVAEHHDGFQMYKSSVSHWNAWEMGPRRDVLNEVLNECEKRGMIKGASSHRIEHWFFMGHGKEFDSDVKEPLKCGEFYWPAMKVPELQDMSSKPEPDQEFMEDWLVRTCEIIDEYQPQIIYFDWWIQHSSAKPYLKKLAAYYYNRAAEWGTEVIINYKHDAYQFGTAVPDVERGQFAELKSYIWQTDTSIALNSWSYTENNDFREARDIVCDLVDIVSKNGRLLLNVGPKADGSISPEETAILQNIGNWLKVNGKAIYGTKTWRIYGEGPTKIVEGQFSDGIRKNFTCYDFRFTTGGGLLYATALRSSKDGNYTIVSLGRQDASHQANFAGIIKAVRVLGCEEEPTWKQDEEGLHIQTEFGGEYPVVFEVTVD